MYAQPGDPQPRVRPPLIMRLQRRHWIALDCLAAVPAAAIMVAVVWGRGDLAGGSPSEAWLILSLLLAAAAAVPVALRRVRPLAALGALLAISVALSAIGGRDGLAVALPAAYVLYIVAATATRRVAAIALACTLALVLAEVYLTGTNSGVSLGLIVIIFWGFGSAVRQRRAYASDLQQQAASRAVAEERLRIARELHDVVAHSMSVIAVQAGFGEYVIDDQPSKAREALGAIQATSRDALDEMRRMLSVLRQAEATGDTPGAAPQPQAAGERQPHQPGQPDEPDRPEWPDQLADLAADASRTPSGSSAARLRLQSASTARGAQRRDPAPLRPAPGLADLDRLITRVGHAGVHVDLKISGDRGEVPAGVDLSAFRIIQEALTNVVKHAATPDCLIVLTYHETELSLEVLDDGDATVLSSVRAPAGVGGVSSGHGLIGMRERVNLCGGTFSAGPRPGRGFRVAATLPLNRGRP